MRWNVHAIKSRPLRRTAIVAVLVVYGIIICAANVVYGVIATFQEGRDEVRDLINMGKEGWH